MGGVIDKRPGNIALSCERQDIGIHRDDQKSIEHGQDRSIKHRKRYLLKSLRAIVSEGLDLAKPRTLTNQEVLYTEGAIRSMVGFELSRTLTDNMISSGLELSRRRLEAQRGQKENIITVIATEYYDHVQVSFISKIPKKRDDWIWDLGLVNYRGMSEMRS